MLSELKTRLADLERAARAAERRDEDLAGMVAGLNRAFGALCRVLEEDRPGTAARLLAALEEAADDPEESYSERVTEKYAVDARVHSGVPAGHRQLHEPENRQGQVVNEPLVADARPSSAVRPGGLEDRGVAGGSRGSQSRCARRQSWIESRVPRAPNLGCAGGGGRRVTPGRTGHAAVWGRLGGAWVAESSLSASEGKRALGARTICRRCWAP